MTDLQLLELNQHGFIPGPLETESQFLTRVKQTQKAMEETGQLPRAHWDWAKSRLNQLFAFEPESLPVFYSNKKLACWHGAACWISDHNIPVLQLRTGFKKGHYLKIYSREEILAHEAVHAARVAFEEPENEEFFAYASTSVKWRAVLGPLIRNSWEPWILLSLFAIGLLFWWSLFVAILLLGFGFFRLARQHWRLARASSFVLKKFKDAKKVRAFLFRLTDAEIQELSEQIWPQDDGTLRWRLIQLAYIDTVNFSNC